MASSLAAGEWNTQRLKRLLATDPEAIKSAATRDKSLHEVQVFAAALAAAVGPPDTKPKEGSINVKVVTMDGNEVYFKAKPTTPIEKIAKAFCQRQGVEYASVRFMFDGNRIPQPGLETPRDCNMEDGDVIDVVVAQQGGCIASPVPALFGRQSSASPGLGYLDGSVALADATPTDARALIEKLGGSLADTPQILSSPLLDAAACADLMRFIDERAAQDTTLPADLRLTASNAELTQLIGDLTTLRQAFGGPFDTIKLRRVTGPLGCVPFHTDFSKRTLHVALNEEYEGGRLTFATHEGLVQPERHAGSATLHVNCVVHGTSSLISGTRYSLFLCDTTGAGALDLLAYLVEPALAQFDFFAKAVTELERATDDMLAHAVERYADMLLRTDKTKAGAAPTSSLLVDLVRRTHMLRPAAYRHLCSQVNLKGCCGLPSTDAPVLVAWRDAEAIAAVRRQQAFMRRMLAERAVLETREAATAVLAEYVDFLGRVKHSPTPLVPSLAVDWLWHTHMQHPERYAAECLHVAGSFVDHDDANPEDDEVECGTGAA